MDFAEKRDVCGHQIDNQEKGRAGAGGGKSTHEVSVAVPQRKGLGGKKELFSNHQPTLQQSVYRV